jgi:hypothetical protein
MKKQLLILTILLISLSFISTTFAQTAPGDGSEPLVYTFKNNNGNNPCGGDAEFKVAFSPMPVPDHIPAIKEIWYDDGKTKKQITIIATPVYGEIVNKTQPYVSYCLNNVPGTRKGNIDPSIKLTLVFETR